MRRRLTSLGLKLPLFMVGLAALAGVLLLAGLPIYLWMQRPTARP